MDRTDAGLTSEFLDAVRAVFDANLPDYDQWLYSYYPTLRSADGAAAFVRQFMRLLDLAGCDVRGQTVLDAGCGFGVTILLCGLLGAAESQGIDLHPGMVRTVSAYLPVLPAALAARMGVTHGDVSCMPYSDESFDLVLSIDAISHYRFVDRCLAEICRVLKPGGTLVLSDENNGLNPLVRRRVYGLRETRETHHRETRRQFICRSFPGLAEAEAFALARQTFDMTLDEIQQACGRYLREGVMPRSTFRRHVVAVDPYGGVEERLFDPIALGEDIAARGFEVRVSGYWGGSSGRPLPRMANHILARLSALTIYSARQFRIVAVKTPEGVGHCHRGQSRKRR